MHGLEDKTRKPDIDELRRFVGNPLLDELCRYMDDEYQALQSIEYSGDNVLLGWNLKFKKAGRTLCTVYPRPGHFLMLLIVGRKEKERVEQMLPDFSEAFQRIYRETKEGMGQRWMILDFDAHTDAFDDAMKVVKIRRESK